MSEAYYYERTRKTVLNRAREYYKNNKERLREQAISIENYLKKEKI